ncbi:hypothetical protein MATL_G00127520 [Megalops atlanticus]|uniref:Uncharacterized protein n=1 Tax=Megalops atlanticus TaxID=7932 RepID=A0A9D3PX40_MEGAT|nr:hypothetical protein MATL_G00127520 [Megalops atlanticus]
MSSLQYTCFCANGLTTVPFIHSHFTSLSSLHCKSYTDFWHPRISPVNLHCKSYTDFWHLNISPVKYIITSDYQRPGYLRTQLNFFQCGQQRSIQQGPTTY